MKPKQLNAAYIEWEDSNMINGWTRFSETEHAPVIIQSVGLVIHKSKNFVTLSTSIDTANQNWGNPLSIPASAIRVFKPFKVSLPKAARKP